MRGTLANSPQLSMISISLSAKVYQWISSFVRDMSLLDQCHSFLFSRKIGDLGKCETIHLKNRGTQHMIICCVPLFFKWIVSHLPKSPIFRENKNEWHWSRRLMSLTNDDIHWYI